MLRACFANVLNNILNRSIVFLIIQLKPQTLGLACYSRPQRLPLFSDTTSKNQGVYPATQLNVVAPNKLDYPINKKIKG